MSVLLRQQVEYVCFGGAGALGIAYLGALRALTEHGGLRLQELRGAVGTSSGALAALCICVGISFDEFEKLVREWDMQNLAPHVDVAMLLKSYGLDDGSVLREFVGEILVRSGLARTATFADVHRLTRRHFACTASNMNAQCCTYFDHVRTPGWLVLDAVYASMCVPMIFAPLCLEGESVYVDGCLTNNVPLDFFPIASTLVLAPTRVHYPLNTWRDFSIAVLACGLEAQRVARYELLGQWGRRAHLHEIPEPSFAYELTQVRTDLIAHGYVMTMLRLHPELALAVETLLYVLLVRTVQHHREETP